MTAVNPQDSATGDEVEEESLDASSVFRLEEACRDASEALELDRKDAKAAALHRYALYALDPEKRLVDKAEALREEAGRCAATGDCDKALELLSVAKKWHCTPNILSVRAALHIKRGCFDLAYLNATELLAGREAGTMVGWPNACLHYLGYKAPPVTESVLRRIDALLADSPLIINRPKRFQVEGLEVDLKSGHARVKDEYLCNALMPPIPLDQLARYLNNNVQGAVKNIVFESGGERREEEAMLRLLDEMTVPGRLHVDTLVLEDFFHLPWADIKRILDGRTLRAETIHLVRLQLPRGVDPNELLKLPTIRECNWLNLQLYDVHRPQLLDPPPLFKTAALLEWLEWSDGHRTVWLAREYLSLGFLDALKKDFRQATLAHSYLVMLRCPDFDVANGLGVQDERLSNRLGERMVIGVGEEHAATEMMGHQFETVKVERFPPDMKADP